MKKIIVFMAISFFAFNCIHAQCEGKTCKINGGEATVMVNDLSLDQSNNTLTLRVSNDGPSANFKLKVTLKVTKNYTKGIGEKQEEVVVYFNEMAYSNQSSRFEKSFTPNRDSDYRVTRIEVIKCEFQEGTICR
ncbi:MAG: hypothetical protein MJ002_07890 [Paludibacteraceae bacterium]|nr:hypothetical protein [Paludibacteraceae bacterium]